MAPLKQPGTLRRLAKVRLANLTLDACTKHEESIVRYGISQRVKIVEEMQEFIGALPERLLNEVCQLIIEGIFPQRNYFNKKKDSTFAYAVVMHKDVNQISIARDLLRQTHETEWSWNDRFKSMSKLSEVIFKYHSCELSFVSTITDSCPNLKKITLTSGWYVHSLSPRDATTAIALLTRCTQLRYIDCRGIVEQCGDLMQHLLESLPGLEVCIVPGNDSLGDILTRMRNCGSLQLQLRYFNQHMASPTHVDSMIALCPRVTHLNLRPETVEASDGILNNLKNSSLKIQTFVYVFTIPITQSPFVSFLESKGSYLTSLELDFFDGIIQFGVLTSIGKFCPHLEMLNLHMEGISSDSDSPENSTPMKGTRPFQKLSTLEVGVDPDSSPVTRIVDYCLGNSIHLKSLRLCNAFKPNVTFDEFVKIFALGRMRELKCLDLDSCYFEQVFTKQMVQHLYESFQQLTCMQFYTYSLSKDAKRYLDSFAAEAKKNNIDFVVKLFSYDPD